MATTPSYGNFDQFALINEKLKPRIRDHFRTYQVVGAEVKSFEGDRLICLWI